MSNELEVITNTVMAAQPFYEAIDNSPEATANFNREANFAIQIISGSKFTREIAIGARQSVIDAVANVAACGLTLNPAMKQAYLVPRRPRKGERIQICLDISYIGLIDLAIMGGSIKWAVADLVYTNDRFTLRGVDEQPVHERDPFAAPEARGDLLGAYVVAKTSDGAYLTTMMSSTEILDIRDRSDAWKAHAADPEKSGGPWQTDFGEMAKKTVIKRAAKLWSKTDQRLAREIHRLNEEAGEGLPPIDNEPAGLQNTLTNETRTKRTLARLDMPIIKGGVGAERAKVLRAAAGEAVQRWNEGDEMGAYAALEWLDDPDEQEIVWCILAPYSSLRSAVKRLDAEARARQAKIDEARRILDEKMGVTRSEPALSGDLDE